MNAVLMIYHYQNDYILDLIDNIHMYSIVGIVCFPAAKRHLETDSRCLKNNIEIVVNLAHISRIYDAVIVLDGLIDNTDYSTQVMLAEKAGKDIIHIPTESYSNAIIQFGGINIPIISVCKTNGNIKALKMIASLKRKFESKGFSAGVMTTEPFGDLLNFQRMSLNILENQNIDFCSSQIYQQIKKYIDINKFQVLILDYPGCIGDKYMFAINSAIQPSYTIVLSEAYRLPDNYRKFQDAEISSNYCGTVDLILMSEYMFSFIDNSIKYGARLSKESLEELTEGIYPSVFNYDYIYQKIMEKLENPEGFTW